MRIYFFLIFSLFVMKCASEGSNFQTTCKLASDDLNDCIKKSFEEHFSTLHNPEPNPNYPFVDPFYYAKGKLHLNRTASLKGYFAVKNMTVTGASMARIKNVETFFDKGEMMVSLRLFVKQLNATGLYKTNVTLSGFSLISKGKFNTTFDNSIADLMIDGKFIQDKHRYNVTRFEMMPTVQNMKFSITGLVKDENSNRLLNNYVNQGWKPVYRELLREARPLWNSVALGLMNELFGFIKFE